MAAMAVIQTGSRGGLACVVAGLLAMLWDGPTRGARVRNAVLGLAAIALLVVGTLRSETMRNRIEAAAEGGLAGREEIYPALFAMIADRPLIGWGPIENQVEIAERIGEMEQERRDAHNLLLELLSTTGLAGAAPFLIGLLLVFRAAWRARRGSLGFLPLAFLLAAFTGTISGTWIAAKILWLSFGLALAAGALVARRRSCAV
jgi:O-antigen ligase